MHPKGDSAPGLLFADDQGVIYDHQYLEMAAFDGVRVVAPGPEDLISLPSLSKLFYLPQCPPIGYDRRKRKFVTLTHTHVDGRRIRCHAVAAFMEPGYARTLLPAAESKEKNYTLPMWAYSAVGSMGEEYAVCGFQVEDNQTWNPENYDDRTLPGAVESMSRQHRKNRLLRHLADCAMNNHCFAAKNLFWRRWEAPIPVSRACNASCLGCISLQQDPSCQASHRRISFRPTVNEIVDLAAPHLEGASGAIVSFGQGCEGEPLTEADLIAQSVAQMRKLTAKGSINLNTNGSMTAKVLNIVDAGLDCIRISMNSVRPELYHAYYRPKGYTFDDVVETVSRCAERNVYTMINYLIFPGITDQEDEMTALFRLVRETGVNFIHFKNLCIDPYWYLSSMKSRGDSPPVGIKEAARRIKQEFPRVEIGYFNQPGFRVKRTTAG